MMSDWGDTKKLIFEDIVIYSVLLAVAILWDFLHNLMITTNVFRDGQISPMSIGSIQFTAIILFSLQLIRRAIWWKYYE